MIKNKKIIIQLKKLNKKINSYTGQCQKYTVQINTKFE